VRYAFINEPIGNRARLGGEEFRHQIKVLRRRIGDRLALLDGRGGIYQGRIEKIDSRIQEFEILVEDLHRLPRPQPLELIIALPRAGLFDTIIQKAVELGVTRIVPLLSERSQIRLSRPSERERKMVHWEGIAIASCKQSGNPYKPVIELPVALQDLLPENGADFECLLLHPDKEMADDDSRLAGGPVSLDTILLDEQDQPTRLAFGPEGGFSKAEIEFFLARGYRMAGLGQRILRLETAVVAALVLIQARNHNL
jgi:16S rRNA (uracil1498-N3)-methyltransferase